jgi:Ca2+-binding EF-hand superfamily protein
MDINQDGSVSAEELTNALQKQRETMMGNQQAQGQSGVQNQSNSQNASGAPDAKTLLSSIMSGQMPTPPSMQGQNASSSNNGSGNLSSKLFSSLDSDSSNSLSVDETGLSQSVFDSMDVNQDGSVSADELATALEKQRAAMGSGQGSSTRTQIAQSFLSAIANSAYQTLSQTTATTQGVEAVA